VATLADLVVRGRFDGSQINRGIAQTARELSRSAGDIQRSYQRTNAQMEQLNRTAGLAGRLLAGLGVSASLGALVRGIGGATARMDTLNRGLVAIEGSASAAAKEMAQLRDIARLPGIDLASAVQGASQLDAVQQNLPLVNRELREFANAIALSGGGAPEMQRVVTQLTQLSSKGKILSADLRPIIEAAPLVGRALKQAFGTVNAEDIEKLGLSTNDFLGQLLSAMEQLPRATSGVANDWENLTSGVSQAAAAFGTEFVPSIGGAIRSAGDFFTNLAQDTTEVRALADAAKSLTEALTIGGLAAGAVIATRALAGLAVASGAVSFLQLIPAVTGVADALTLLGFAARGLFAAIGPAGWLIVGIGALATYLFHQRDAAREAAASLDTYKSKLLGLNAADLAGEHQQQSALFARVKAQRDALKPLISNQEDASRDPTLPLRDRAEVDSALARNQRSYRRLGEILTDTAGHIRELREAEAGLATTNTNTTTTTTDVADLLKEEAKAVERLVNFYAELRARKKDAAALDLAQGSGETLAASLAGRAAAAPTGSDLQVGLLALERKLAEGLEIPLQFELSASQVREIQRQLDRNEFTITPRIVVTGPATTPRNLKPVDAGAIQSGYQEQQQRVQAITAEAKAAKEAALQHFRDTVQATQAVTSSFGDLADALGDVSPAVSGALRGVESFANGLTSFRAGRDQKGALGTLSQISGVVGMAAGVAQALGGLGLFGKSDAEREREEILKQNNEALDKLRASIDMSLRGGSTLQAAGGVAARVGGVTDFFRFLPTLTASLKDAGLTMAQLESIAKDQGITLTDSKGNVLPSAFRQLADALGITIERMTQFGNNLDDIQKRQSAYNKLFDVEASPQQQLNDAFNALKQMDKALLDREGLTNVNLDTEAGRNVLASGLQDIFKLIDTGKLTADLLGGFTDKNQLLDAILATKDGLNGLKDTADQVSDALTNVPQGFRIANLELIRFNAQAAATAASLAGSTSSAPPQTIGSDTTPWMPRTRPLEPAGPQVEYSDHRVTTFNVYQQPGEDGDALARRLEKMMDEKGRRDNLTNGKLATDPWSPRAR
jgi:tape measure domain-containing protein